MTRNEIETVLKEYDAENPKTTIDKIMDIHGKDVESAKEKLQGEIDTAKNTIASLKDELEQAGDSDELKEKLKEANKKIAEFETAEKKRKEAEEKAKADKDWENTINPLFDSANIRNDKYTRQGLSADVRAIFNTEGNTKGVSEILAELVKDKDEYKENPQQQKVKIPGANDGVKTDLEIENKARAVMGLKPKE